MEINLETLREAIDERTDEIETLRHELVKFIGVDKKLNVIIDPDSEADAQKIISRIEGLRKDIRNDKALLAKVVELKQKYNLSGRLFPNPDTFHLDGVLATASNYLLDIEKNYDVLISQAKARNSPGASGPGTAENLIREKETTLAKEKSEIEPTVARVRKAMVELDEFMKTQEV